MSNLSDASVNFQRRKCKVRAARGVKRHRHIQPARVISRPAFLTLLYKSLDRLTIHINKSTYDFLCG